MKNLLKRVVKYVSRHMQLESEVDFELKLAIKGTNYFHESSAIFESSFGEWIKIQNNCYISNCVIGSYSYFAGFDNVMNATIGKFCSIASFVSIAPGKHPVDFASTSPVFFSIFNQCGKSFADRSYFDEMGSVVIGNDVWIGVNAVILDNVTIGDGAIIAAGAIVTKDVEPYTIVGGVPAKFIKKRFADDAIAKLLEFKWWDKDDEWLQKHYKDFHSIEAFELLMSKNKS